MKYCRTGFCTLLLEIAVNGVTEAEVCSVTSMTEVSNCPYFTEYVLVITVASAMWQIFSKFFVF